MPRTIPYVRPWLYQKQLAALFTPARLAVIEASTKSGKTVGALIWLHERAALAPTKGRHYWWIAPVYSQARIAFTRLKGYLPRGSFTSNDSEMYITLRNGSIIEFKSAVKPDYLYGEDVYAAVIDEATRVSKAAWHAVRSTLTATRGPIRIIGNVKGTANWMYDLARRAEKSTLDGDNSKRHYARLTAYDAADGGIIHRDEIEDARSDLPDDIFNELYLAIASDRERRFSGIPPIVSASEIPRNARWVRGWDFATTEPKPGRDPDWTAGVKIAQSQGLTYIVDVTRFREGPTNTLARFKATVKSDACDQVVEEEIGAAGKILTAAFQSAISGMNLPMSVHGMPPSGDKVTRAFMLSADWSNTPSRVRLVEGEWNSAFLDEVDYFPHSAHDDQVDGASYAYNWLSERSYLTGGTEVPEGVLTG